MKVRKEYVTEERPEEGSYISARLIPAGWNNQCQATMPDMWEVETEVEIRSPLADEHIRGWIAGLGTFASSECDDVLEGRLPWSLKNGLPEYNRLSPEERAAICEQAVRLFAESKYADTLREVRSAQLLEREEQEWKKSAEFLRMQEEIAVTEAAWFVANDANRAEIFGRPGMTRWAGLSYGDFVARDGDREISVQGSSPSNSYELNKAGQAAMAAWEQENPRPEGPQQYTPKWQKTAAYLAARENWKKEREGVKQ